MTFGSFKLKSGRVSPYFFNAGLFQTGESLANLGKYYASALQDSALSYDVLFGPAYKGIPLVASLVISLSLLHNKNVPYSFNRKEVKDHGEGGNIVAAPLKGKVVVIDDVISAGTAIRESVEIIKDNGATLCGVLIALDRQEKGSDETSRVSAIGQCEKEFGVPVIAIVKIEHVVEYLREIGGHDASIAAINEYRKRYGA